MAHVSETKAEESAAARLPRTETRYRALFMAMEQAFCIIEKVVTASGQPSDYRYVAVNPAFARHSGLPDVVGQTLRQLVPGVEAHIVAVFDDALASGQPRSYEEYVTALGLWITAEVLPDPQPGHLAVLFSDSTERKRREANLAFLTKASDELMQLTSIDDTVNALGEQLAAYLGLSACAFTELTAAAQIGVIHHGWHRADMPDLRGTYRMDEFVTPEVLRRCQAGEAVVVRDVFADPLTTGAQYAALGVGSFVSMPLVRDGEWRYLLVVYRPDPHDWRVDEIELLRELTARIWTRLERARAEEALRRSELEFRSLVAATSDVVYKMSADWGQMHQLLGKRFLADLPLPSGNWLDFYIPEADQGAVQAAIEAAMTAKALFELEHRVRRADGRVGWVYSRALPLLDTQGGIVEWLGVAQDITARKQAEMQLRDFNAALERQVTERTQALRESYDLLRTVAESQTVVLSAFSAVRDNQRQLVDVECSFVNARARHLPGYQPVVGQRYLAQLPEAEQAATLALYRRVLITGITEDQEVAYTVGLHTYWRRLLISRLGDGVLVSSEDITVRKQAEQERNQALNLLEQAETVAQMGSWDYNLATQTLTWSGGMYRLLGMLPGSAVSLPLYLERVVDEDRAAAEQLVRQLQAGAGSAEETLRLRVGNTVKTVRVKAVLLPGEHNQPARMLGVDLDVSDVQRLEAENLALRLDQQKTLLVAILQAQETERSRLAETLHNGLGQVLYAIRLQLSQLDVPALHALPELNGVRHHADHLLSEAIGQARTLAHELMPATLTEHGLGHALRDICRGMSTPRLHFSCQVWLDEQALPLALQTTLYRLAQELAHNIAKHSGASQATLEFELLPGWVVLRAEDNGQGFDSATTPWGLGLRLLHDAVDLLDGVMQLDSSPEYGTHVRLRIPIA